MITHSIKIFFLFQLVFCTAFADKKNCFELFKNNENDLLNCLTALSPQEENLESKTIKTYLQAKKYRKSIQNDSAYYVLKNLEDSENRFESLLKRINIDSLAFLLNYEFIRSADFAEMHDDKEKIIDGYDYLLSIFDSNLHSLLYKAQIYRYKSVNCLYTGNSVKALDNLLKGLEFAEENNLKDEEARTTLELGNFYFNRENYNKAKELYIIAKTKFSEQMQGLAKLAVNFNLAAIASYQEKPDEAIQLFEEVYERSKELKSDVYSIQICSALASLFHAKNENAKAKKFFEEALEYDKILNIPQISILLNNNYGNFLTTNNEAEKGLKLLKNSLKRADDINATFLKYEILEDLKNYYEDRKNSAQALFFTNRMLELQRDTLNADLTIKAEEDAAIKYQTEKVQLQLDNQKLENENLRNTSILGLFTFVSIMALTGFAFVINRRNQKTKEKALQQEIALSSTNALLDGQQKERKRVAKELHDSLGALLSATKMHFSTTKKYLEEKKYNNINTLIDDAAAKARAISHDILPPSLSKFGLCAAIEEMGEKLSSEQLQFEVNSPENKIKINENLELDLYQMINELMNNAIKYSEANKCTITFTENENQLKINVKDNGKGINGLHDRKDWGMGLSRIDSRMQHFGGTFHFSSKLGKGTSANLHLPLKSETQV